MTTALRIQRNARPSFRTIEVRPCARCGHGTDMDELARNDGLYVSCCIECETSTFALEAPTSIH